MKKYEVQILFDSGRPETWICSGATMTEDEARDDVQAALDAESIASFRGQVIEVVQVPG